MPGPLITACPQWPIVTHVAYCFTLCMTYVLVHLDNERRPQRFLPGHPASKPHRDEASRHSHENRSTVSYAGRTIISDDRLK